MPASMFAEEAVNLKGLYSCILKPDLRLPCSCLLEWIFEHTVQFQETYRKIGNEWYGRKWSHSILRWQSQAAGYVCWEMAANGLLLNLYFYTYLFSQGKREVPVGLSASGIRIICQCLIIHQKLNSWGKRCRFSLRQQKVFTQPCSGPVQLGEAGQTLQPPMYGGK